MTQLGFSTYVFVERLSKNAAILHPFPEHNIALVREALGDAGIPIDIVGPHAPERGEGVYFEDSEFPDEMLGIIADALTVRGIGAYAYGLFQDGMGDIQVDVFTRSGASFPREGRRIVLTRLYVGKDLTGPAATTWVFGAPRDLEEVNALLSESFATEPVYDPSGMSAIEIRHPEFAAGLLEPAQIMDALFQVLGKAGFEGPAFCEDRRGITGQAGI